VVKKVERGFCDDGGVRERGWCAGEKGQIARAISAMPTWQPGDTVILNPKNASLRFWV